MDHHFLKISYPTSLASLDEEEFRFALQVRAVCAIKLVHDVLLNADLATICAIDNVSEAVAQHHKHKGICLLVTCQPSLLVH